MHGLEFPLEYILLINIYVLSCYLIVSPVIKTGCECADAVVSVFPRAGDEREYFAFILKILMKYQVFSNF